MWIFLVLYILKLKKKLTNDSKFDFKVNFYVKIKMCKSYIMFKSKFTNYISVLYNFFFLFFFIRSL